MNNKNNALVPYIDATYYTGNYKPNKNSMITGTFNNVEQNAANFDAFRNRASEIVDRLVSNRITYLGGIDAIKSVFTQEVLRKATAAFVEHWYLKGFTLADLDSAFSVGSLSARQMIKAEKFRQIAPLSAIANIQKSGMWDNRLITVDLEKELSHHGLEITDLLTLDEALVLFSLKGYESNFHIELDLSEETSGLPNTNRYIRIASTPKTFPQFEFFGGTELAAKSTVQLKWDGQAVTDAGVLIFSQLDLAETPDFYYKINGANIDIYVRVNDDLENTDALITNIVLDEDGQYGVLGSQTNSNDLTEILKESAIGKNISIEVLDDAIRTAEAAYGIVIPDQPVIDLQQALDRLAKMNETVSDYELDLTVQQAQTTVKLKAILQSLIDDKETLDSLVGSYVTDDPNSELDETLSVIRNIVIIAENLKALDLRLSGFSYDSQQDRIILSKDFEVQGDLIDKNGNVIDVTKLATTDLLNVIVDLANANKVLSVGADGKITYIDAPTSDDPRIPQAQIAGKYLVSQADGTFQLIDPAFFTQAEATALFATKQELTDLDTRTKQALVDIQNDLDNIVNAISTQEVWTGTFALGLNSNDNNIAITNAALKQAISGVPAGNVIFAKIKRDSDSLSEFLTESVGDASFTQNTFYGDKEVEFRLTADNFELKSLGNGDQRDYTLVELRTAPAGTVIDITTKANKDLSNVNVGAAEAGKLIRVKADGSLEYTNAPAPETEDVTITETKQKVFSTTTSNSVNVSIGNGYKAKRIIMFYPNYSGNHSNNVMIGALSETQWKGTYQLGNEGTTATLNTNTETVSTVYTSGAGLTTGWNVLVIEYEKTTIIKGVK